MTPARRIQFAKACFLHACRLDVAVRKPGNVSAVSPGHGMDAQRFIASAQAAAAPLFEAGARVGPRIEAAMAASLAAAGCNTNLGIVLLCAPIAAAVERADSLASAQQLRAAVAAVLADLDVADAQAAYRAIARANPGGLGHAPAQDVRAAPSVDLRAAMALATPRDSIAAQYASGYADLFELALPALQPGFTPMRVNAGGVTDADTATCVQRVYLLLLGRLADSHIVRKHGESVAQTVMRSAQEWLARAAPERDPQFAAWDESLKARGINPGTSADLTVAALLLAALLAPDGAAWHET
ncbi:MAG TPA: triphosphoribosyl-dephospho-CoA synthase [Burkholderiaceae bacterium]|nr:triphosphoribosyl-dephospho-CoA synthase [Burkholderiaceae bacterium]